MSELYIRDNECGEVRKYGTNCHDGLKISEDGKCLYYDNLQNGDGSIGGGYSFVLEDGKIPSESKLPDAEYGMAYANIGGFHEKSDKYTEVLDWNKIEQIKSMPQCCGYPVLLTVENKFGQRRVCKAFTNYMEGGKFCFLTNEKEYCSELTSSNLSDSWKPIAWKSLPEPYTEE
ncbi:MAG: hypothetical protein PHN80_06210 [Hespellia sp.]|nr:hypothetical protein [Hespellia sp.]